MVKCQLNYLFVDASWNVERTQLTQKKKNSIKMKKVLSRSAVDPLFATSESVFLANDWWKEIKDIWQSFGGIDQSEARTPDT